MIGITVLMPLVAGLALLSKGASTFVDGASGLATKLGIPPLIIGLTLAALGTSAPEAAITITAAAEASNGMAIAGVFGSNIVNTLVVLGITALAAELPLQKTTLKIEIPFVLITTGLLLALCTGDGSLSRLDAGVLLTILVVYLAYVVWTARRHTKDQPKASLKIPEKELAKEPARGAARLALLCLVGALGIYMGAKLTVCGATELMQLLGISERVAGLTVIAVGTSLPELVTSLAAARKGQTDIAVGNVVGSSIFNILFVLGISGVIAPIPFEQDLIFDGIASLVAVALLWTVSVRTRTLRRAGGTALLTGYAVYLACVLAT